MFTDYSWTRGQPVTTWSSHVYLKAQGIINEDIFVRNFRLLKERGAMLWSEAAAVKIVITIMSLFVCDLPSFLPSVLLQMTSTAHDVPDSAPDQNYSREFLSEYNAEIGHLTVHTSSSEPPQL